MATPYSKGFVFFRSNGLADGHINPYHATSLFLYSQKTFASLMFLWIIERDQWHEMGHMEATCSYGSNKHSCLYTVVYI